jgi:hypothetical protein
MFTAFRKLFHQFFPIAMPEYTATSRTHRKNLHLYRTQTGNISTYEITLKSRRLPALVKGLKNNPKKDTLYTEKAR